MPDQQQPPDSANPQNVLSACVLIERLCAQLYLTLADAHRSDPEIHALWKKTAAEETNHAEQIGMAQRVRKGLIAGARADMQKANEAVALVRTALRQVTANPPSVVEALRLALDLEARLNAFHLDEVAVFVDPSMKTLFRAMQSSDRLHVESIREALRKRAPDEGV